MTDGEHHIDEAAILEAGKGTLELEAASIKTLADRLDPSFARAVGSILACSGRVVVTGLGKSGLVGRKIAATLASTGTPAFFVHAAEAHHGDAGMVVLGDVLIAISNSGETHEVVEFAKLAKTRGVVVVAMSGRTESSLTEIADECLFCGVEHEADPLDLAPTSSTTATMALGDALGVALMVVRRFTAADFRLNHPAGALGVAAAETDHKDRPERSP